jgi:2,4-dienoyl-CoA reductase-like NADH-dependent reductase (Old Yellow Enzyme family)
MADYYALRAQHGVGLILTEGTVIHSSADGYNNVPHIQTQEQTESWCQVVNRVHAEGGKILCQLWHCGRISHEDYTSGLPPLSSVCVAAEGVNRQNNKPYGQPRAMTGDDFEIVLDQFIHAAKNALQAGFDGVQLHLGHGYLADQFLDARINNRTDEYGGSVENRCRFALEITGRVIAAVGSNKVMARISPSREMGGLYDWPDLDAMLAHIIPAFANSGLRMLDVSCANADYYRTSGRIIRMIRNQWPHLLIGGASLTSVQAEDEIAAGLLDMVTWGRHLIANPALPERFRDGRELVEFERDMLSSLI